MVPIELTLIHLYDDFHATALQQWLVALQVTNVRADQERRVRPWGDGVRERLTPFERHLLELMASGLKRKEIARAVKKSPQTVSNSMPVAKDNLAPPPLPAPAARLARPHPTST